MRPATTTPASRSGDRGEGVISMAIAVLIVAFLGVLMWFAFQNLWTQAEADISGNVNQIGAAG
ncbi:MAG: hypothetical protein HKN26_03790 [Acidimicrobiales bacterium]|nr:hypothetical protein [Acidimicrobiales bacterium]